MLYVLVVKRTEAGGDSIKGKTNVAEAHFTSVPGPFHYEPSL